MKRLRNIQGFLSILISIAKNLKRKRDTQHITFSFFFYLHPIHILQFPCKMCFHNNHHHIALNAVFFSIFVKRLIYLFIYRAI